jgi:hypothetical protein
MRPIFLLFPVVLAACVQTNAAILDVTAQHAPICPDGVKLYTDTASIGGPFERVAVLTSTGSSGLTTANGMMNSQRQRAAKLGANGVLLGQIHEASAGAKVAGAFLGTGTERTGEALAIYVPGDSARVARACDGTSNRQESASD